MFNRRRFLFSASASAGLALLHKPLYAASTAPAQIQIDESSTIAKLPKDIMGLSYESIQLGEPEFFSTRNTKLIEVFRRLSPTGVLRLGGNTSEFSYFKAHPHTHAPIYHRVAPQPMSLTPITPEALQNLRGFLDATGWDCIYGLNLGNGTPDRAAEEAEAAVSALGPKLKYLQIGNEPNNYIRYKLRPSTWNASAYLDEWLPFARAILARVPEARLGGPDMGAEADWMQLFATRAVSELGSAIVEITDHFYAEGPPTSPEADIQHLLHNTKINHEIAVMQQAGKTAHLPYRMTEVNSCYSGGKPGVSDCFAAALWGGELTLKLLAEGFSGVNFHGGSARLIKASLGGVLPGNDVAKAAATDSYYTPISGDIQSGFTVRPLYYGLELAARFAGSELLSTSGGSDDLKVYAARKDGKVSLALFNMSMNDTLPVKIKAGAYKSAKGSLLSAPSLRSQQVRESAFDARGLEFNIPASAAMLLNLA